MRFAPSRETALYPEIFKNDTLILGMHNFIIHPVMPPSFEMYF